MQSVMPKLMLAHRGLTSPQSQQTSLPEIFNNCSHTLKFQNNKISDKIYSLLQQIDSIKSNNNTHFDFGLVNGLAGPLLSRDCNSCKLILAATLKPL